jgi:hypothetical protein
MPNHPHVDGWEMFADKLLKRYELQRLDPSLKSCQGVTVCTSNGSDSTNLSIARVINHIHRLSLSICAAKAGILRSLHSSTMTLRLWNALRRRRCPCTCAIDTSGPEVLRELISNEGICRREVCLITWFCMTSCSARRSCELCESVRIPYMYSSLLKDRLQNGDETLSY